MLQAMIGSKQTGQVLSLRAPNVFDGTGGAVPAVKKLSSVVTL
jgi:hypothetical protein